MVAILGLLIAGCSSARPTDAEMRRLIENSPRFTAPDVVTVRPQYCSTVDAPGESISAGMARLKALEAAGAIRIEPGAAAPSECTSLPGPMRERLVVSLGDASATFHARPLDNNGGWEFPLARRRFVSLSEVTINSERDPPMARAVYRWAWKGELLGQLLQVSEEPVNAQATFIRSDSGWDLRDLGF